MAVVTIDASEAHGTPLRGWGRYVVELLAALRAGAAGEIAIDAARHSGRGPEVLWEQVGLPRSARRAGAAVVHAPNCFLPLRRPCPGVVTVHDLAFETHPGDFSRRTGMKYRALAPRAVRSAERVICVSAFTARDVQSRYGVDPEKLRVVPLAPALALGDGFSPVQGPYLLAIGDLRAKKDLPTLVQAWRELREEGLPHRLVLAGLDAGEGDRLAALAGRHPLELTGYVDDARLDALLRGADALVHPSRHEGFGLVLIEAMARGVPVIAAQATALPETGGDAALYFEPGNARALAGRLRELLGDAALRETLIARGHERAGALSWAATAALTAAVYRELIQ
jgi:glycosyltransferase involved in cell wall biosynthesis